MPSHLIISQNEARQLVISSQGLSGGFDDSLDIIRQLSYIQIDTISVTERTHNHVLFSRNPNFKQNELIQLMDNKSVFEYWSHAASYIPIEDFRFSLLKKHHHKNGGKHWFPRDNKVEKYVLDKIKSEGSMQSKDFINHKGCKNEWYEWKPAKTALTHLFMEGSIMIANRKGFQKIFDITERVLPPSVNTAIPTIKEYCKHLIDNAIKSHGLVALNEVSYLRRGMREPLKQLINELLENKEISSIRIKGNDNTYYSSIEKLRLLNINHSETNEVHILNPFDNILIQRKRIKELFNFDYQVECYVPEKKRVYGYYTLPVLYGSMFVMRFDAKADRKTGILTVKGFWYEKEFKPTKKFKTQFNKKLNEFATFCGCQSVNIKDL